MKKIILISIIAFIIIIILILFFLSYMLTQKENFLNKDACLFNLDNSSGYQPYNTQIEDGTIEDGITTQTFQQISGNKVDITKIYFCNNDVQDFNIPVGITEPIIVECFGAGGGISKYNPTTPSLLSIPIYVYLAENFSNNTISNTSISRTISRNDTILCDNVVKTQISGYGTTNISGMYQLNGNKINFQNNIIIPTDFTYILIFRQIPDGNWEYDIAKNTTTTFYNRIINGIPKKDMISSDTLHTELNKFNSVYGFSCLLIWDRHINDNELFTYNEYINKLIINGGNLDIKRFNLYKSYDGGNGIYIKTSINIRSIINDDRIITNNSEKKLGNPKKLKIIVGNGGNQYIPTISTQQRSFGGGGIAKKNGNWEFGGGGGMSGIFLNKNFSMIDNIININSMPLVIAGGGGAGGADGDLNTINSIIRYNSTNSSLFTNNPNNFINIYLELINSGSEITDIQINVSIPKLPIFSENFQDLRFYDNTTEISYYIDSYTSISANIILKIPNFINGKQIRITYGNSSNRGNPNNVYLLYDNFETTTNIDNTKWDIIGSGVSIASNRLSLTGGWGKHGIISKGNMLPLDTITEIITSATANGIPALALRASDTNNRNYGIEVRWDTRGRTDYGMGPMLNNPFRSWPIFSYPNPGEAFPNDGIIKRKIKVSNIGNNITEWYADSLTSSYRQIHSYNFSNDIKHTTPGYLFLNNHVGDAYMYEIKVTKATTNTISATFNAVLYVKNMTDTIELGSNGTSATILTTQTSGIKFKGNERENSGGSGSGYYGGEFIDNPNLSTMKSVKGAGGGLSYIEPSVSIIETINSITRIDEKINELLPILYNKNTDITINRENIDCIASKFVRGGTSTNGKGGEGLVVIKYSLPLESLGAGRDISDIVKHPYFYELRRLNIISYPSKMATGISSITEETITIPGSTSTMTLYNQNVSFEGGVVYNVKFTSYDTSANNRDKTPANLVNGKNDSGYFGQNRYQGNQHEFGRFVNDNIQGDFIQITYNEEFVPRGFMIYGGFLSRGGIAQFSSGTLPGSWKLFGIDSAENYYLLDSRTEADRITADGILSGGREITSDSPNSLQGQYIKNIRGETKYYLYKYLNEEFLHNLYTTSITKPSLYVSSDGIPDKLISQVDGTNVLRNTTTLPVTKEEITLQLPKFRTYLFLITNQTRSNYVDAPNQIMFSEFIMLGGNTGKAPAYNDTG